MTVSQKQLDNAFSRMILSASGWRKIFVSSQNEEDSSDLVSEEDKLICTAVALVCIKKLNMNTDSDVFIARDARPTGPAICNVIGSVLKAHEIRVHYAGICSAPEAMAQSSYYPYSCFIYVSASHNPIGHNGIKLGKDGGVFGQKIINPIIDELKNLVKDVNTLSNEYYQSLKYPVVEDVVLKEKCLEHYADFVRKTTSPDGSFEKFVNDVKKLNVGIVADLNGSARCLSIDKSFLASLGVKTSFINDTASIVAHGIVPEGNNLLDCCKHLEKMHNEDPSFVLGYVPDNDGDRGNLVYVDDNGKANILKAQEVFALCVSSTLAYHRALGTKNLAVAINCSTSRRIDEIAKQNNAKVFRAEVGEANVVNLAQSLREKGFNVPILGEGANGGNITHPAKVRDPMNTLMCMLRLLQKSTVSQALANLPVYTTTDAFDPKACLHLQTQDYKTLKAIYEKNFENQWKIHKDKLARYGLVSYLEFQTEGISERCEAGKGDKGGLRMVFYDDNKNPLASIWMRPSGTEPLFRVLTDVKGNNTELHDYLLDWQKEMILNSESQIKG